VALDLTLFHLIVNASFLVQFVILILVLASIASWTMIFKKGRELKLARKSMDQFEERFWSGGDLNALHQQVANRSGPRRGPEHQFDVGFSHYARMVQKPGVNRSDVVDGMRRAMRVALNREADTLELHLPFLATVGSISPFVGLFGTVWGIMNSFHGLANVGQATLAMVAPGISEALIATAMGLFAAIPAVVAYNRYVNDVEKLVNRYDNFCEEFSQVLQRQIPEVVPLRRGA